MTSEEATGKLLLWIDAWHPNVRRAWITERYERQSWAYDSWVAHAAIRHYPSLTFVRFIEAMELARAYLLLTDPELGQC